LTARTIFYKESVKQKVTHCVATYALCEICYSLSDAGEGTSFVRYVCLIYC